MANKESDTGAERMRVFPCPVLLQVECLTRDDSGKPKPERMAILICVYPGTTEEGTEGAGRCARMPLPAFRVQKMIDDMHTE